VSYACDRRGFSITGTHASYQNIMHMDIDLCQPHKLRIWNVSPAQPIILYVEHNPMLRLFLADVFNLAGWYAHEAFDLSSGESMLRSYQRFSLLLAGDELSPYKPKRGLSGLQLVTLARSLPHRKEMPILFFSIEDRAEQAKAAGADEFLRKPYDLFLLVDTIRKLLAPGDGK